MERSNAAVSEHPFRAYLICIIQDELEAREHGEYACFLREVVGISEKELADLGFAYLNDLYGK